jgi:hypothetical protein
MGLPITMELTKDEIFHEVLHTLGVDGVDVELTEKDLEVALKDSMRRYSRANPLRDRESMVLPAFGIKTVPVHPETYAVIDVQFQDQLQVLEGRDHISFNIFNSWQVIGAGYGGGGMGDTFEYAVLKQWRDLTRREFSLEPDWYFEQDQQYAEADDVTPVPRRIHFFNPTGLDTNVMWVCVRARNLKEVIPRDHDWIIDWTAAHSKEILGRKRGKFRKIPSAGQPLEMDGPALIEEAKMEKSELSVTLKDRFIGYDIYQWG